MGRQDALAPCHATPLNGTVRRVTTDAATPGLGTEDAASAVIGWRGIAVLAGAVLAALTLFGVGVLLPYYVNDLHRVPLSEVASGAYDPKDLWPQKAWAGLVQQAGFLGVMLLPLVALTAVGVAGFWSALLWRRPGPQRVLTSMALLAIVAGSVATLLFLLSETGEALRVWRMD